MGDDLAKLPFAIGLGRRASTVIRQNLVASLDIVAVLLVATVTEARAGIGPAGRAPRGLDPARRGQRPPPPRRGPASVPADAPK